jgi:hypothetical protein
MIDDVKYIYSMFVVSLSLYIIYIVCSRYIYTWNVLMDLDGVYKPTYN